MTRFKFSSRSKREIDTKESKKSEQRLFAGEACLGVEWKRAKSQRSESDFCTHAALNAESGKALSVYN